MFNWTQNITYPKLTDVFNNTSGLPFNVMQMFTYAWVWFLGGWFFAGIIGVIGGALYEKYDNMMVPIVFFIIMIVFFGGVLEATPVLSPLPSADGFTFILGLIVAFGIGIALYQLFINSRE